MFRALLFALALLIAPSIAVAQIVTACVPSTIGGTGTRHVYVEDSTGFFLGWVCPAERRFLHFWGRWADMPGTWRRQGADALAGGKPGIDALVALVKPCTRAPDGGCYTPAELDGVIKPGWQQLMALIPAPPSYRVVRAPANANPPQSRPMYAWDGVKRGSIIQGLRAAEFAPCTCTGYREGESLYCTVPSTNRVDAVTLCEPR